MARTAAMPQPRGLPLIGNLADLNAQTPVQSMMALARAHGPIFRISAFGTGMIVVSSQQLVNEICDDKRFEKGVHRALKQLRDIGGDGVFTAYTGEANWGKAHRLLTPPSARLACAACSTACSTSPGNWCSSGSVSDRLPRSTSPTA